MHGVSSVGRCPDERSTEAQAPNFAAVLPILGSSPSEQDLQKQRLNKSRLMIRLQKSVQMFGVPRRFDLDGSARPDKGPGGRGRSGPGCLPEHVFDC